MELTFLGTSSMVPTAERNHSSAFLKFGREGILMDCGEGTQRQLRLAGIPASKITRILISHWHGDHVLGLPGLLQTMSAFDYEGELHIYGPEGTRYHFDHMKKAFEFEERITIHVHDVTEREFLSNREFSLEALPLDHTAPCLGYRIVEKDKVRIDMAKAGKLGLKQGPLLGRLQRGETVDVDGKSITPGQAVFREQGRIIAFVPDTALTQNCFELAEDADLVVCESTYANDLEEKAQLYKHLTAGQAGQIASRSGAKKLVLTHFSQRYPSTGEIEEDARVVFDNVTCAKDFMRITIEKPA